MRGMSRKKRQTVFAGLPFGKKAGPAWKAEPVWPEDTQYNQGVMVLSADDMKLLQKIMKIDPSAILVNGEYSNVGCPGTGALPNMQVLTDALRWQYEDCHPIISGWELRAAEQEAG